MARFASVPTFFLLRIASGFLLLKLSASFLPVGGFAVFSQFLLFTALLNLVAVGGAQNGLIRQAAAAADAGALARVQAAAFLLWGGALPVLVLPIVLASPLVSDLLAGAPSRWPTVCAIALVMFAAGPGQIWCSLLSGRKRAASSLAAQALGLVAGTGAAAAFVIWGEPAAAAIAFAGGGLVTAAAAYFLASRLEIPRASLRTALGEARTLLRYSAALTSTTSFYALVLFVLRLLYRNAFGATQLGYWLAANRISDMSTQLLGLFLIHVFVPHLTTTSTKAAQRGVIVRGVAMGAAGMSLIFLVFSAAPRLWVRLFLSDAFLPAIPSIQIYMIGDTLRVWPSLAMFAAFAQGRPGRFAAIDMGAPAIMAPITIVLIGAGVTLAAPLGYVCAYAIAAAATSIVFLRRRRAFALEPPSRELSRIQRG